MSSRFNRSSANQSPPNRSNGRRYRGDISSSDTSGKGSRGKRGSRERYPSRLTIEKRGNHFFESDQKNDYFSFQLSCFGKSKRNSRQPTSPCFRWFIFYCSIGYQEQNTELVCNDFPPTKKKHRPNSSEEKKGADQNSGREKRGK